MAALKRMLPRNRGMIVQVGSALVYRSIPLQSAYCAAKHAVAGFTDSLRCELIYDKSEVRITMVQMPALNTRNPLGQKSFEIQGSTCAANFSAGDWCQSHLLCCPPPPTRDLRRLADGGSHYR
jgi:NAD(P)-dependent dehydrogenase (short-subunit alcohol dehydrogenase family)